MNKIFLFSMKKLSFIIVVSTFFVPLFLSGCFETNKESGFSNFYRWSEMDEGPYHDKISFATSTDLFNWTDSGVILAEHASVPGAVYKDGVIYVYFVDVSVDGVPERIALIKSEDNGKSWSEKQFISVSGLGDKIPVDPAPFLLEDGRIRLYYFDINEERISTNPMGENKIYSMVSSDGVSFVQEPGVRFSKQNIYDPDVVRVGDTWRLYVGEIPGNQVISAVSTDGLIFIEEGVAYEGGVVPDVFFENNVYYLYTAGVDIAVSEDGVHFSKTLYGFHLQQAKITADPSVIKLDDGTYMMFYKFSE